MLIHVPDCQLSCVSTAFYLLFKFFHEPSNDHDLAKTYHYVLFFFSVLVILGIGRMCDARMDIFSERKEEMSFWERTVEDYKDLTTPIYGKISNILSEKTK